MPLPALPPDPKPTPEELRPYSNTLAGVRGREFFTELSWRTDLQCRDDSAFHVAFATEVEGYPAYLKSDVWKAVRKRVLKAAGRICAGCGGKATQVHHRDYRPSVLRGDNDLPLVALCSACHRAVHAGPATKSWQECERDLKSLVDANDLRVASGLASASA